MSKKYELHRVKGIFKSLKSNLLVYNRLEKDIKEYKKYIEYYNNSRIKSKLKRMFPIQY